MKVLLACPDLEKPGGVANYFRVLRRHLTSDVVYFIVGARQNELGLLSRGLRFCKDNLKFAMQLKSNRYDIVHLNPSLGPNALIRDGLLLLIAKLFCEKSVVFFRGWDHKWEEIIYRFFPWIFRFVYFRANAFIVLSKDFKLWLQSMGYSKHIYVETTVVPDGIFTKIGGSHSLFQDQKPVGKINLLFLTHIERQKGIYETVNAYHILKGKYPQLMLTLAGCGTEVLKVQSYIEEKGICDVKFLGYVTGEAKHLAFSEGDIYIFPSYSEGMPNSVLEAMAYGLPIITTAVGGLKDFFKNGEMGFITEDKSPEHLAELIELLIRDHLLLKKSGEMNRLFAKEHFAASKVAGRLEHIYREVITL